MAKPDGASIGQITPVDRRWRGVGFEGIPTKEIVVQSMTDGQWTSKSRDKLPVGSAKIARNARSRDYWIGRRPGTNTIIAKPDSNPVYKVITLHVAGDRKYIVRITASAIHASRALNGWQVLTGSGLTGTSRITSTQFFDDLYIATAHAKIIKVNVLSSTFAEIEDAPKARFITSFADRIFAANILPETLGATRIQWTANALPEVWDPLENEGAGEENLVSSPSDTGDDITGLQALAQEMLILRERSIWIATRQPIVFAPVRFTPVSVNHGCDLPYSVTKVENGVVWADFRTRGVWLFQPGALPQRISGPIDDDLFTDLANLRWAEGAYDPFNREYHLGLALAAGRDITKTWVFSFDTRAWTYDDSPTVRTIGQNVGLDTLTMIDDLTGFIDGLNPSPDGVIDDWAGSETLRTGIFKGTSTGEVIIQSYDHANDWDATAFEFEWQSQNIGGFQNRRTIQDLMVTLEAPVTGTATFTESKDEAAWTNSKAVSLTGAANEQHVGLPRRQISGNELYWRVRSTAPQLRLLSWWVRVLDKFAQRQQT